MQTEYVRSLNCNYERILLEQKPEEKRYQYCILNRGGIRGLLPCSLRYINGLSYLYYDISSKQNVAQLYGKKSVGREWLKDFIWGVKQIRQELERFLLDCRNVVWYPEQIFQDLENNQFYFLYIPYYDGTGGFDKLLDFLLEHIDYDDEALVECVYHMYEQYEKGGETYLYGKMTEDIKRLELAVDNIGKAAAMDAEPMKIIEAEIPADRTLRRDTAGGEKNKNLSVLSALNKETGKREAVGMGKEEKKSLRSIFEGRKKREKGQKEDYYRELGKDTVYAVAEETVYDAKYGQTMYMEIPEDEKGRIRSIYLPDGSLLANLDKMLVTIGKMKGEADIVFEDSSMSRLHARITKEGDNYYLEDLNSTNGTFKNGLRLQPYEKKCLEAGDDIRCGRVLFLFR